MKGMNDFTLVPAIAYRKQTREIDLLLREAPEDNSAQVQEYNVEHAKLKYPRAESGYAGDSLRTAAAATGFDHSGAGGLP